MPAKKRSPSESAADAITNYLLDSKKIKLNTKSKQRIQELITERYRDTHLYRFLLDHIASLLNRFLLTTSDIGPAIIKTDLISYFYYGKQVYPSLTNKEIKRILESLLEEIPDDEGDE